jgi:hypothetical protein
MRLESCREKWVRFQNSLRKALTGCFEQKAGPELGTTVRLPTDKNFEPRFSNTTTQRQVFPRVLFLHDERSEWHDM